MRILAIDYGSKKFGFAITDNLKIIASSHSQMKYDGNFLDVLNYINKINLFYNNEIEEIVIGLPINMNGTESQSSFLVREFSDFLKKNGTLPVSLYDERLTTKVVKSNMINQGFKNSKISKLKDQMAAQVLLESYLSYKKNTK